MKKLLITLLCLLTLTTSCKQKSSETTGGESAEVAVAEGAAQNVTPQQLAEKWSEKAIAVKGGGEAPDVVTLLQAFSKVWSTQAVNNLLAEASDPNFTESVNTDIGAAITVDRKNGFAELGAGDSDDDCMGAGVWKCDNGHLLFALNVVTTQTDRRDLAAHRPRNRLRPLLRLRPQNRGDETCGECADSISAYAAEHHFDLQDAESGRCDARGRGGQQG